MGRHLAEALAVGGASLADQGGLGQHLGGDDQLQAGVQRQDRQLERPDRRRWLGLGGGGALDIERGDGANDRLQFRAEGFGAPRIARHECLMRRTALPWVAVLDRDDAE